MFLDLYQNLGDEAFRQGFRDLHSMTFVDRYEDFDIRLPTIHRPPCGFVIYKRSLRDRRNPGERGHR